jgi:4-amino-4-deoxy-L-arabinose transferase-like glycosyltransferase
VTPRWHAAILAALAVVLLLVGLGASALTDRDEGANAEAAREMWEQGAWITPTLNYAPRFAKPAFVYWLTAGAYATLGVGEAAARLPSALATALLIGLQYAAGRWALGPAGGFRAALILLLGIEVVALGRLALTDAVLVLWTTAAGYAFLRAHLGAPPRGRWYAAGYLALGLALLAKGPVGVLVPVAAVSVFLAVAGGAGRAWREAHPLGGLALVLLVAGPWYAAMFWRHGGEYLARAEGETLGRVFRTVTGPGGTALFYLPVVLLGFFPWSALLPGALWTVLRRARAGAAAGRAEAAAVFAAVWVVTVVVLFSLVQSRLPHYVAPLFPMAALLLAATWPDRVPALARGLLAALGVLLGGALLVAGLAGGWLTPQLALAYPAEPTARLPVSVAVVGLVALAAGGAALTRDGARLFPVLAGLTAAMLGVGLHAALPAWSAAFVAPGADLARRAATVAGPCDTLVVLGPYRPSFVFYARRPIVFAGGRDVTRVGPLASRPGRLVVLTPRDRLDRLPATWSTLAVVESRGGYVLLASPAADCPGAGPIPVAARRPRLAPALDG